jgi:hypothetical protein
VKEFNREWGWVSKKKGKQGVGFVGEINGFGVFTNSTLIYIFEHHFSSKA